MKEYDAVVVGAGPAGSTTALRLAEAGANVLVVDKARFPRDKPCGGGMTLRAVRQCPVDPSPVVEDKVDIVELRFRYSDSVVRQAKQPVVWMTQRRRLDAFLLDAARERGVEVREETRVAFEDGNTLLLNGSDRVKAAAIVGADGANGVSAKALGLGGGIVHGVAYEGNASWKMLERDRYEHRAIIELADIPGGYGWVFAKGDHANVGVGAWLDEGPKLREYLDRLCEAHGIDASQLESLRGHRLPLRRPGTTIAGERALLVGDAAGLVDPTSGDGMYECFVSSKCAADAILELLAGRTSTLAAYEPAVDAALGPLHKASWKLKVALDRWPRASWRVARTRLLWTSVERLLTGEIGAPGDEQGFARIPLRALSVLGARR